MRQPASGSLTCAVHDGAPTMPAESRWKPFGITEEDFDAADSRTVKVVNLKLTGREPANQGRAWLRYAMIALALLAATAATVSWDAQYVMVRQVKHNLPVAALEATIPDVGALIFAALGIALALHGKRALRARTLNVACVGLSLTMNALASAPGWRDLAIWVMPSAVYALASDTLIGVIRAWVIAANRATAQVLADDEATPMAVIGGLFLWLLRLSLAPPSTITGFRRWALDECPVAPGRKATPPALPAPSPPPEEPKARARQVRAPGKQARLIALATERHDLAAVPLGQVSQIANAISAEVDLSPGTARRVLLAHVRTLQNPDGQTSVPQPDGQPPQAKGEAAS
jgi:hypothetical protein